MTKRVSREKIGEYEIQRHPGGITITGPILNKNGIYIPNDEKLKRIFERERKKGKISHHTSLKISWRGFIETGELSLTSGKKVLGIERISAPSVTLEEIEESIRDFWPEGEENPRKVVEYMRQYPREHHAASRSFKESQGGLEGIMNRVKGDGFYDYVRKNGRRESNKINEDYIIERLEEKLEQGEPINKSHLISKRDKASVDLYRDLDNLSKRDGISFTKLLKKLLKIESSEISLAEYVIKYKRNSNLSEKITEFLIRWGGIAGLDMSEYFSDGKLFSEGKEILSFRFNGSQRGISDLRKGNQAIEVKGGTSRYHDYRCEHLLERYKPDGKKWFDGEPIESSIVVFNQSPYACCKILTG